VLNRLVWDWIARKRKRYATEEKKKDADEMGISDVDWKRLNGQALSELGGVVTGGMGIGGDAARIIVETMRERMKDEDKQNWNWMLRRNLESANPDVVVYPLIRAAIMAGSGYLKYMKLVEEGENADSPELVAARDELIKNALDIAGTGFGLNLKAIPEAEKTMRGYQTGEISK
jgi:hypothetical protein